MTSEPGQAFVWVWLPGAHEPVVSGRLNREGSVLTFTYGQSYLGRKDRLPLFLPELPLQRGPLTPPVGPVAGCIADSAPDAWGQRVILNARVGRGAEDTAELDLLTYLLESGSDRIGALDFQRAADEYVAREAGTATLAELAQSAERVEQGVALSPALDQALLHGSSVGGARPKALLRDGERRLIAKFSSTTDAFPVVKGEFIAMELARRSGLDAARVKLTTALGKDALLIERFDRPGGRTRRGMVSALTILELDEMSARYASYAHLADRIRARFNEPGKTLRELFGRIVFNVLVGNTDDHARNHAAFWDGTSLALTPAYDICPQARTGGEAAQLMAIGKDGYRMSQLLGCVVRAPEYGLSETGAREIVDRQIDTIEREWADVCDGAELSRVDRARFWQRQFLNPYATEGY